MEELNTDDILTFDELLEDDYYKSEFDKRVKEYISHSGVTGGKGDIMENTQTPNEGEIKNKDALPAQAEKPAEQATETTENPAADNTEANGQEGKQQPPEQPAKEMTAEQFERYNETLRRVSKTAKGGLNTRYNAFEDAEVKAAVKAQVMAGETPDVKSLAESVVTRLTHKEEPQPEPTKTKATESADEVAQLKAELALIKAGIVPERLDAAKKLFLAAGGDPDKAVTFVDNYPEWKAGGNNGGVVFSKAPPLSNKTAANSNNPPVLNDFERKVAAARKKAGLD